MDNQPNSYMLHPENAIPTESWYDDKNDDELYELTVLLEQLAKTPDVRMVIPLFVENDRVNFRAASILLQSDDQFE